MPLEKQNKMMEVIIALYKGIMEVVSNNIVLSEVRKSGIIDEVIRMKYNISNDNLKALDELKAKVSDTLAQIVKAN